MRLAICRIESGGSFPLCHGRRCHDKQAESSACVELCVAFR